MRLTASPTPLTADGHLLEFPRIRVDSFTDPHPRSAPWTLPHPDDPKHAPTTPPNAQLYLLTHVHSDHLIGLRDAFVGRILCSPDTKRMLLRLESEKDKDHYHHGIREVKKRKYEGLCARQGPNGIVDYIVSPPLGGMLTTTRKRSIPESQMSLIWAWGRRCASLSWMPITVQDRQCE